MKINLTKEITGEDDTTQTRAPMSILGHALLHMMIEAAALKGKETWELFGWDEKTRPFFADVECTVNGVPINPQELIEHLYKRYDEDVNERAQKLIKDKCNDLENYLSDLRKSVERAVKKRFPTLNDENDW